MNRARTNQARTNQDRTNQDRTNQDPRARRRATSRRTGVGAALLLGAATLTACGGGEDSDSPEAYADAVASAWSRAQDTQVSQDQARCWGERVVDRFGVERVRAAGTPAEFGSQSVDLDLSELNLSQAEAQAVYDDFASCGGDLARDKDLLVKDLGLPEKMQGCVSDALDERVMKSFFVHALQDGKDKAAANIGQDGLQPALEKCVEAMGAELAESLGQG